MTYTPAHPPTAPPTTLALDAATAELSEAVAAMHFTPLDLLHATPRGLTRLGSAPARGRARSLSPQRRSPKLRHTNGRLDIDPVEAVEKFTRRGGADERVCALLSEDELQRVIQLQTQANRSASSLAVARARRRVESHSFPTRKDVRRSSSCLEAGASPRSGQDGDAGMQRSPTPRRFTIYYRDEALRESCAKNTRRMIENARRVRATSPSPLSDVADATQRSPLASEPSGASTTEQQIAWRALRYRRLLARADEIDEARLNDPSFDVLECLGAQWCRV